jgi:hypothetical protein
MDIINNTFLGTGVGKRGTRLYHGDAYRGAKPAMVVVVDAFRGFVEHHPLYDPRPISERRWRHLRVRRACKAGIEWVISDLSPCDRQLNPNPTVHFLLEGLNLEEVVHKSHYRDTNEPVPPRNVGMGECVRHFINPPHNTKGQEGKQRSITGSELRWIYRHRNDPRVQARVQFRDGTFENYYTCGPPWDSPEGARLWSEYHPRSEG